MLKITTSIKKLWLIALNSLVVFILTTTSIGAQNPYQVIRLNNGDPIIEPSMFSNATDGDNINGPSLIRVPDWIPTIERAHSTAQYYLYFADHIGDYIRMAWAANIEGPYTLYDDSVSVGDRGVLDNNESDIILANNIVIQENHLASPDVIVDDVNQRIIMYFHSGSSFFVNGTEVNKQVSWVSTSPYGLEFYNGIEPIHFGKSYFRVFEYDNELYSLENQAKFSKALDYNDPWGAPVGHNYEDELWETLAGNQFQDDINLSLSEIRVRHTAAHVEGDELMVFYSRRGELQERIMLSTIDLSVGDWSLWDPTYPPIEILTPNPGWEGGQNTLAASQSGDEVNVSQLRDPDIFKDADGQYYVVYSGNGEGGLGIAKLYPTPTFNTTLTTTADAHIKGGSSSPFGGNNNLTASSGATSGDQRTIYMRFDLTAATGIEDAVVRIYANETQAGTSILDSGSPITVYETTNGWDEATIVDSNAPALGNVITTTYLTDANQYYEWNISEYAKANEGNEITVAFKIAPSNSLSNKFNSRENVAGNPGQLLLKTSSTLSAEGTDLLPSNMALKTYPNPFTDSFIVEIPNRDGQSAVSVKLINLLGKTIFSKEISSQSEIEFKDISLASGMYMLNVSYTDGKSILKKVIKADN
ncbi:DUF7594 domain-containing protein [Algibacter sp.]|uniref:CBM96 family carbohydrate-binding protein n=1 Tax=Algibacter sp. TaxID=1872428 RepID=UPI003C766CA6